MMSTPMNVMESIGLRSNNLEDSLARQSDVRVSTNVSLYGEYKGVFTHVIASLVLLCFIVWSLVPDVIFEDYLQFDYLPDKYWSVAIPSYSLMLMLYIYIALALYNTEVKTLSLDDVRNFTDEHSVYPGEGIYDEAQKTEQLIKYVHSAPSGVWDLPITLVNEVLYTNEKQLDVPRHHNESEFSFGLTKNNGTGEYEDPFDSESYDENNESYETNDYEVD